MPVSLFILSIAYHAQVWQVTGAYNGYSFLTLNHQIFATYR